MDILPYILIFAILFGALGIYGKGRFNGVAFSILMCTLWFLFSAYGRDEPPHSIFEWLITTQWGNPDFALIWLMLPCAGYVIFKKRRELAAAPKSPSAVGISIALLSLAVHVFAFRAQLPSVSVATVVFAVWGTCYAVWGWRVARILLFPMGYALFCLTNHLLIHAVPFLRVSTAAIAEWALNGMNIETARQGSMLCSPTGHGFTVDVAGGCSGLHSLVALTAIIAPYAYFYMKGAWRKWTLFLLSVPVAVLANLSRVIIMAVLMRWMGMGLAMPLGHDAMGYAVVVAAVWLLIKVEKIVALDWKSKWAAFWLMVAATSPSPSNSTF